MANKISGLTGGPSVASPLDAGRPVERVRDATTGGSSTPQDTSTGSGDVHITDSASQLASLEQTLRSLPAVDGARVAQLQTAIEQGTYTVQPQQVADQLIQLEQALAGLSGA